MRESLILLSLAAPVCVMFLYVFIGTKRSHRASTVSEYLIFGKKVPSELYVTTTVAYALQLAVTVYFVYWGFRYGLGTIWYLGFWWAGIYLFEKSAPKLLTFAKGSRTLHGFLEQIYGNKWKLRQLAAICTILGMTGALLVELNFATDVLTGFIQASTRSDVPVGLWITLFSTLCLFALWYVTIGGYKAATVTDAIQLPFSVLGSFIVLTFLGILGTTNGYINESRILLLLCLLYLAAVFFFRKRNYADIAKIESSSVLPLRALATRKDRLIPSLFVSSAIVTLGILYAFLHDPTQPAISELADSVSLFSLSALWSQLTSLNDWLVLIGFLVLDLSWQFVDMAAWQRIESIDLQNLDDQRATEKIRTLIRATKWESPFSWSFGILLGIALHYSGLFQSVNDAEASLTTFVAALASLSFDSEMLNALSILVLPAMIVAFLSIMFSTADSCIAVVTFSAFSDFGGEEISLIDGQEGQRQLKKAQRICFYTVVVGILLFLTAKYLLEADIFLILNLAYASQLSLLPVVGYALFSQGTINRFGTLAAPVSIIGGLIGTYLVGWSLAQLELEDLAYVIPNYTGILLAFLGFHVGNKIGARRVH